MKTAADAVQDVLDFLNEAGSGNSVRAARRAVIEAMKEVSGARDWSCYRTWSRIVTKTAYSTGTITYDHTGGTYERMVTLSIAGTWPSWVGRGSILLVANVGYRVDERISNSVITLSSDTNPGDDLAALTAYSIHKRSYELPANVKSMSLPTVVGQTRTLNYLSPRAWAEYTSKLQYNSGQPQWYTILGEEDTIERLALLIHPLPDSSAYTLEFLLTRLPAPISTWEYKDGTVTTTSGSKTVTGSGTAWTSRMTDSVFRASTNATDVPTPLEGEKPYAFESRVKQVVSATELRLYDAADQTLSGVKHQLSDPLDFEPGAMLTCFARCAERQICYTRKPSKVKDAEQAYLLALDQAGAADSRVSQMRGMGDVTPTRVLMRDMPIGDDVFA